MKALKILCPVDFSDQAWEALESAAWLARRLGGELTLLHATSSVVIPLPEGGVMESAHALRGRLEDVERRLEDWRKAAASFAAAPVGTAVELGEAATVIDAYARKHGFDMIVMGTHGRTGLAHVLLGSVAEKVVRTAPCAVLTIRVPQGKEGIHAFERQRLELAP